MTRQRRWQLAQLAQGRCRQCGNIAVTSQHCRPCADKSNAWQKARKQEEATT